MNRNKFKADYLKDIRILKKHLAHLPTLWDGKSCVLELKEADYNWRQMEWWAFYFEYKCIQLLSNTFEIPGERYNNVIFDFTVVRQKNFFKKK